MREVLEQVPPETARWRRALLGLAGLGIAALVVSRFIAAADEPVADPPVAPPQEQDPAPIPGLVSSGTRVQPISEAPLRLRMIELVSANRWSIFNGQLGSDEGRTTITGPAPFATDDVIAQEYGAGVVVGPAPGTVQPETVRGVGVDVVPPAQPVGGIVKAIGGGYWILDTARTAAGACQMHLVMLSGQIADPVVTYPCDFVPQHETVDGFVGTVGSPTSASSGTLLDRDTGALSPIGGALLEAVDRYLVRWTRDLSDPLVVEDLVNGDTVDVELPAGRPTRQVELNLGGRYLAVVLVERLISVRSYEVWVHDLVEGDARMATVTTLDTSPLELAWHGDVLVVAGNDVEVYDADPGTLYRSPLDLIGSRLDVIAMAFALQ